MPGRRPDLFNRSPDHAIGGMFLSLAILGLLLFLPQPAPPRHGSVDALFRTPKIALRAAAPGRSVSEARR